MRTRLCAALAACSMLAFAPLADARERAPRQSVLEQVRAGAYRSNCTNVAANADAAARSSEGGSGLFDAAPGAPGGARQGVRVMPDAQATAYLREMLARFVAVQAPPAGITPSVWIQDSQEVDARQRGAGDIYITRGALSALMTTERGVEDPQIAADVGFILAHEYSHVLMCHYQRVLADQSRSQGIDNLANAAVGLNALNQARTQQGGSGQVNYGGLANQGRFNDGVASTMAAQSTLKQINSGLVNPALGREQERDADYLAVELMRGAGMPTDYVPELLVNLNTAERSFLSNANSILGRIGNETLGSFLQQTQAGGQVDTRDLVSSFAQRSARALATNALQNNFGHFHDDPEKRAERVALMMEFLGPHDSSAFAGWAAPTAQRFRTAATREFAGPELAFQANQLLSQNNVDGGCAASAQATAAGANIPSVMLAAANCAVARNQAPQAAALFNRLAQSPYAVPADFSLGSQVWAAARNRQNATRLIDLGSNRFGNDSFYVPRMLMLASFSDTAGVTSTRDQCVSRAGTQQLKNECTQVAGQITGQTTQAASAPAPTAPANAEQIGNAIGSLLNRRN